MSGSDPQLPLWLAVLAISEQATRDWLTGLYTRRYFEETLSDHIEAATRYDRKLSLVLLDIDNFKGINDSLGHPAGDAVLQQVGALLKSTARKADMVCRYGGDEFAVILPETGKTEALQFVNRISEALRNRNKDLPPVSITAGIAALPCENLVAVADEELLKQKRTR